MYSPVPLHATSETSGLLSKAGSGLYSVDDVSHQQQYPAWLYRSAGIDRQSLRCAAEPLWGALFAWTLLGERWGATGWLGAALIVGSSLGAQLVGSGSKDKTE